MRCDRGEEKRPASTGFRKLNALLNTEHTRKCLESRGNPALLTMESPALELPLLKIHSTFDADANIFQAPFL